MNVEGMNLLFYLGRTTIVFSVLLLLTRILGKKQMSQLTFFNYITGITIGSISSNIVCEPDKYFFLRLIGLTWWCVLTILIGYAALKSERIRHIVDGEPAIIIDKGKVIKKELDKVRLNKDDLVMLLRKQGVFSVSDVEYAILEKNGDISIIKKESKKPVTKSDIN